MCAAARDLVQGQQGIGHFQRMQLIGRYRHRAQLDRFGYPRRLDEIDEGIPRIVHVGRPDASHAVALGELRQPGDFQMGVIGFQDDVELHGISFGNRIVEG
jgi:hypothetical protein